MDENSIYESVCVRLGLFSVDAQSGEITVKADAKTAVIIQQIVSKAVADCTRRRGYPSAYTEEMIAADIVQFESVAVDLSIYDYNKMGAEGESSHNENGTYRSYDTRQSVLRQILPLTKVVA